MLKNKRIVLKIGTRVLTDSDCMLNEARISDIVKDLVDFIDAGNQIILVSSGAIGAGLGRLKKKSFSLSLRQKQALASIGQTHLMGIYDKAFGRYGKTVAQLLLTADDMDNRLRYLNARNTILTLLDIGVIPIINENDTVAVDEIKFGDNDRLSAIVAAKAEADILIILTDVDGFFSQSPKKNKPVQLIKEVKEFTPELEKIAGGSGSEHGTGGMITKLEAARIAASVGIKTYIANGNKKGVLKEILAEQNPGTIFLPSSGKMVSRKRWLAFGSRSKGKITVDDGAKAALLERGKSLLPSGIVDVKGDFGAGESVSIVDLKDKEFARGLTYYSSGDIKKIKGIKTNQMEHVLGYRGNEEVIHRNNLVLIC